MINILIATLILVLIIFIKFKKHNSFEIVYEESEKKIGESQQIYWVLKNNHLDPKYEIPVNWDNMFKFGRYEETIKILVKKENVQKAKETLVHYRTEQRKMERNIRAEREKSERLFKNF